MKHLLFPIMLLALASIADVEAHGGTITEVPYPRAGLAVQYAPLGPVQPYQRISSVKAACELFGMDTEGMSGGAYTLQHTRDRVRVWAEQVVWSADTNSHVLYRAFCGYEVRSKSGELRPGYPVYRYIEAQCYRISDGALKERWRCLNGDPELPPLDVIVEPAQ